jgi:pyruvate-formate lyase-activating enzyme
MRLITINRNKPNSSVEFYGCPMQCKYCSYTRAAFKDYDLDKVVLTMSDNGIRSVFIGGAEPALHQQEALDLIRMLHKRGKEVVLKTTGHDPDFVANSKGMVSRYVLEMMTPLDDPELFTTLTSYDLPRAQEHLQNTRRTLEVLKGEKVRATLRIIPDRYDKENVERIARDLKGHVEELLLTQFMSNPNDISYAGFFSPGPSEETMMELGKTARKHLPRVRVRGNGFEKIF